MLIFCTVQKTISSCNILCQFSKDEEEFSTHFESTLSTKESVVIPLTTRKQPYIVPSSVSDTGVEVSSCCWTSNSSNQTSNPALNSFSSTLQEPKDVEITPEVKSARCNASSKNISKNIIKDLSGTKNKIELFVNEESPSVTDHTSEMIVCVMGYPHHEDRNNINVLEDNQGPRVSDSLPLSTQDVEDSQNIVVIQRPLAGNF